MMADRAVYPVTISERDQTFIVGMETAIQIVRAETYQGDYVVVPKAHEETILETRDLVMADDVTVKKVPYFETSNLSGKTVYIASEV